MTEEPSRQTGAPAFAHTPALSGIEHINTDQRDAIWEGHIHLRTLLFEEHPLDYLFLEVTRACNLCCVYCGSACGMSPQRKELPISEFIAIARQIAEDFNPTDIMVAITGGEPLTKPGIIDLFCALQKLGFPYGIVSNGWLLTNDMAKIIVDAGMASITLSMDAPPPLNDKLRGEGTSLAVFKAVEALHRAGFAGKLEIFSTVTKPAVPLLEQTRAIVSSMRVPFWRVSPVMPLGRAARRPDLVPGPVEIRQIFGVCLGVPRGRLHAGC